MSTTQEVKGGKNVGASNVKQDDVAGDSRRHIRACELPKDEDGFYKMPDDGLRYSPEECQGVGLQGWLVGSVDRISPDNGPFTSLIIHTTAPTKAVDIEGNVIEVAASSKVEIVATVKLKAYIRFANHPQKVFELKISPTKQKKLGGGRAMWMFDVRLHPEPIKRPAFYPVIVQAPQLVQGGDANGSSDIPF